ncbi:MAG: 2-succinyl-6-hydroxy-2,4-cyclohexadiene-1-carboxylate synthase [Alicyclobacillaceae bacterium]|nr:2-succinyl-6-hydroxy-2,4-cyclohexadiene-1-carboxylate synthase [Alicyclobacillaceae bacterium]
MVSVRSVNLYVRSWGEGPPLLALHGFTGSGLVWQALAGRLSGVCRLVAVDLLGHGLSDAPVDAARYQMNEAVHDLLDLMDQLGHREFDCLGYSMGGRLALALACRAPARIRRLLLESASPGLASAAERAERVQRDEALADRIEQEGVASFVEYWEQQPLFATQGSLPAPVRATQRQIRLAQRAQGLAGSLRGMGTGAQPPLWDQLGRLAVPVWLVTGELDEKFTAIAARMASQLPGARHVVVPGAGHTVHLEQPLAFAQVVARMLQEGGESLRPERLSPPKGG